MTRQILLRSPPANRKPPLLTDTQIPSKSTSSDESPKTRPLQSKNKNLRLGEVAGGTAAECAAVCCCCPCTVMNLLILAVYKLPAGLCKKARRIRRRRKKKKQLQRLLGPTESKRSHGDDELERELRSVMERGKSVHDGVDATETVDMEKEMWDRFYSTGFWRSPSQTEPSS
ncbi:hypothetical protein HS088_TW02G00690 [Tripterygium wilfordii]|uniref:Pollen preferential protein n=1 Tax=Tripterygium wilfordii TaxID=458696 RepID=A0A7J7DZQ1_TRIWF|nr:uncharacterized protein LOC120013220 [Tripterygium wilfordii]KAF5751674.1 hypothetical protein HS088_TW02G00690 [Tripterygium wilfordii]